MYFSFTKATNKIKYVDFVKKCIIKYNLQNTVWYDIVLLFHQIRFVLKIIFILKYLFNDKHVRKSNHYGSTFIVTIK